ncbi:MAG: hypothetical protein ACRDRJ_29190 [Streptosporangiaceae bacterium]
MAGVVGWRVEVLTGTTHRPADRRPRRRRPAARHAAFGHRHAEIAKRIDIAATAIHHAMTIGGLSDLDLAYTPPLGGPWDAVQMGAQAWVTG